MATIIKANQVPMQGSLTSFNLEDFSDQATVYLDRVRAEARKIVKQAQDDAAAIREQTVLDAKKEASADLSKVISNQVHSQLSSATPIVQEIALELQKTKHEWKHYWQESIMKLSIKIAERVIRREIENTPKVNIDLMKEALDFSIGESYLKIHVNPEDFHANQDEFRRLLTQFNTISEVEWIEDDSITPGGCRIETLHGQISQEIESQLDRIFDELIS